MGRYYNGDIEGKFWFAVQNSDDADFFGVTGYQPEWLVYDFEEYDLDGVEDGIAKCKDYLGAKKAKLDKFFDKHDTYNEQMLVKEGIVQTVGEAETILGWYARLELGEKIAKSIEENGQCHFEAEC